MADTEFLIEVTDVRRKKCKICGCLTTRQALVLLWVSLGICLVLGISIAVVFCGQERKECEWSDWTEIRRSICTKDCGSGQLEVTYTRKATGNFEHCSVKQGNKTDKVRCNTFPCPECGWSLWAVVNTTTCSKPCGTGHQTVTLTRKAIKNLAYCSSDHENSTTTEPCNTFKCPECRWSDWAVLSKTACSKPCGTGQQTVESTRKVIRNSAYCSSDHDHENLNTTEPCNTFKCPECGWSNWTIVSKTTCSLSCGSGHQTVTSTRNAIENLAYCSTDQENSTTIEPCNTFKCPECEWSNWTIVSRTTCSVSCGTGHQTVTSTRKAIKNLAYCSTDQENSTTIEPCNTFECLECGWSNWTEVSETTCSKPCGTGQKTVTSTRKAVKNLAYCSTDHDDTTTTKPCNTFKCPECRSNAELTHWSDTSNCVRKDTTEDWTQTTTFSMNPSNTPCSDFYSYACGGWDRDTSIPNGYDTYSKFQELMVTTYCDIKHHLQTNPESDAERKAFFFYQTCSAYGRQYRQDTINRLRSDIKSFSGNTLRSPYSAAPSINILKKIHRMGAWAIFETQIRTSPVDKSRQMLSISVGSNPFAMEKEFSINLPDELMKDGLPSDIIEKLPMVQSSMKLSEDDASSVLTQHITLIKLIFKIFWDVDMESNPFNSDPVESYIYDPFSRSEIKTMNDPFARSPTERMKDLLTFEVDLLKAMASGKSGDNYGKTKDFKLLSVEELQSQCNMISWKNYFADIPVTNGYHIDDVLVLEPDVFFSVCEVVARTKQKVLQSYLLMTYIKSMLPYFGTLNLLGDETVYTAELLQSANRLKDIVTSVFPHLLDVEIHAESKDEAKRWFTCMEHTELAFGKVFGSVYVRNMGSNDDADKVRTILNYVKNAYTDHILQAPWIDNTTRKVALTKIKYMLDKIGYPDSILDTSLLDQEYRMVPDWGLSPATINAVHELTVNDITIPSAIFRLPFFDAKRPMAMNFGGIGTVLGHEITHAFGKAGKLFNEYGQMADWMKKTTEEELVTKSKCFVNQYKHLDYKFNTVDGNKTLDENIADNGGIRAAFYAYQAWAQNQTADEKLDEHAQQWVRTAKLSGEQLFFLSYSQIYCAKWTADGMKEIAGMDHSPGPLRVKGPLMNTEFFQRSFSCPRSSTYAPSQRCQLW